MKFSERKTYILKIHYYHSLWLNIGAISSDCATIRYGITFLIKDYAIEPSKVPLIRLVQREYLTRVTVRRVNLTLQGIFHPEYHQEREEVHLLDQAIGTQI